MGSTMTFTLRHHFLTRVLGITRRTILVPLTTLFGSLVSMPIQADVVVNARPVVESNGTTVRWGDVVSRTGSVFWIPCRDAGVEVPCRPADSSYEWWVSDGTQRVSFPRTTMPLCASRPDDEADIARTATSLVRNMSAYGRREGRGNAGWRISATLSRCDGGGYMYVYGESAEPPVFPLSCSLSMRPELTFEIEHGTADADAGASVSCNGSGGASARVSIKGASKYTPVPGLTVSTKVVSGKVDIQAGHTLPIDILVTTIADHPAPGKYQTSFVYVLELL